MADEPKPFDFGFPAAPGGNWPAIMGDPGVEDIPLGAVTTITGASLGALAKKESDQTGPASSTTYTDDTELFFTMAANRTYYVVVRAVAHMNGNADWKATWTVPSGAAGYRHLSGTLGFTNASLTADGVLGGVSTGDFAFWEDLWIVNGIIPGIAQWRWAQNSADPDPHIVRANSFLVSQRM
jgi:hypothetical protein